MNRLKQYILASLAVVSMGVTVFAATPAFAATCDSAKKCVQTGVAQSGGTGASANIGDLIQSIVNALLFALGAIAVIMIVIGGIRYTISQGDTSAVTAAKNTILYAVIGLVVALFAFGIVNWVIKAFVK